MAHVKLFDLIDDVSYSKQDLMRQDPDEASRVYSPYMTNRALSYHADTIMIANDMNVLCHVNPDMHYRALFIAVRPRKRFSKWFKPEDKERVEALSEWYNINTTRARELLRVLSDEEIDSIVKRLGSREDEGPGRPARDKT